MKTCSAEIQSKSGITGLKESLVLHYHSSTDPTEAYQLIASMLRNTCKNTVHLEYTESNSTIGIILLRRGQ